MRDGARLLRERRWLEHARGRCGVMVMDMIVIRGETEWREKARDFCGKGKTGGCAVGLADAMREGFLVTDWEIYVKSLINSGPPLRWSPRPNSCHTLARAGMRS